MDGLEVVKKVWEDQPKGYYSLSWKRGSSWGDEFFKSISEMETWLNGIKDERDLYFCTTTLSKPQRKKQNVQASRYLWQDLDAVDPRDIKPRPTIAWESSPDRYQALWKLNKAYDPEDVEFINQALARKVKADHGSWILTKVLRIPGTHNYKYIEKPLGKLLWDDGKAYTYEQIEKVTEPKTVSSETILGKYNNKIPEKVRNLLTAKEVSVGSRSDTLWYIEHELAKAGIPLEEIYVLIKNSQWNKFKGRSDEETRLTSEISRAFEDEIIIDKDGEVGGFNELSLEPDTHLMSDMGLYPGWLIKDFWTRKSHGIVAGEPKSFKSTLVMDMMVSVASGRPFLGKFEVIDKGPVIMIQNENAAWIMKDRLSKIRSSKGLVGNLKSKGNGRFDIEFPPELPIYYVNQQGFSLSNPRHQELLLELLEKIHPRLLILDPLYLMFNGDINSAKELNPALSWLLYIKEKYELSLVLVHHWNKSGSSSRGGQRMLGSTTLHGWIESAWYLSVVDPSKDSQEESDTDQVDKPSASSSLVMEREFRGAGKYPLTAIKVSMGEFGSDDYTVDVGVYNKPEPTKKGKDKKPSDEDVREEIKILFETRTQMDIEEVEELIGATGWVVQDCCNFLVAEHYLSKRKGVYTRI
jgi:hypothetical protein